MKLADISNLHKSYLEDLSREPEFAGGADASTRPEGAYHLIRQLSSPRVKVVGEFGSGFSTLALRKWRKDTGRDIQFLTLEHHEGWVRFLTKVLQAHGLPSDQITTIDAYKHKTLMMAARPFDAVFIDHGPTMADRWGDVPWIATLVKPGGLMVFDDWWPEHARAFRSTKRIIRILARMGLEWEVVTKSRPGKDDKAICVVRVP